MCRYGSLINIHPSAKKQCNETKIRSAVSHVTLVDITMHDRRT